MDVVRGIKREMVYSCAQKYTLLDYTTIGHATSENCECGQRARVERLLEGKDVGIKRRGALEKNKDKPECYERGL